MVALKWTEFFGDIDPVEYFSEAKQSMDEAIDLNSIGFTFAVEQLEANIGHIEASQVHWSGHSGVKQET